MEEKVIKIVADTEEANKSVKKLTDNVDSLGKETKQTNKSIKDTGTATEKAGKKGSKGVGLLSKGFKGLGVAMKAAGIGLIVSLVVGLGAAFTKNQRFVDAFSTVMETIGIVFNQVATALFDVYDNVSKSSENFDALGKVLKGLVTIGLAPLKLAFFNIKLALQSAQLVWEKSFFGGKDKDKISKLTKGIEETKTAIFDTGKAALIAGKDVVTNFGEAITETANIAGKVVEKIGKISVKAALETAKTNVAIKNSAVLAVAEQARLLEKFDRLAEKQRQIRDDESKSITERTAANDQLLVELKKQEEAQIKQANIQLAAANAQFKKTGLIEDEAAAIDALANKEGVLAAITGFMSEQDVNRIALKKEEIELNQTISDAEKERQLAKLEFDESQIEEEDKRLIKQKERLNLENQQILEDLEHKKTLFALGTQARVDAEQVYKTEKQRIDNEISANTTALQKETTKNKKIEDDKKIALEEKVETTKNKLQQVGFNLASMLTKKGSKIGKGVAVARALQNTYQGITAELATKTVTPFEFGLKLANIATVSAIGFKSVKDILATNENSSSRGGDTGTRGSQSAPSFNLVQGTDSNQIAQSINGQNNQPVEAYVVSGTMTTQQEADRNKQDTGSI